ncbi:MAG: hypothetical protein ACRC8S_17750 [Fimbriiglobus sp.]
MPFVYNGIGTWYYGKKDSFTIRSQCEFCQAVGELKSYNTTLYFVVVFVPIIPLGGKRILNECQYCQKHRVTSSKEWERIKSEALTKTLEDLQAKPNDTDALISALATATEFQDVKMFDKIAPLALGETENAKLQGFLGDAYSYFSRREDADEAYMNALRVEPSRPVYRSAAMNALRMGDVPRAVELLDYIFEEKVLDDVAYIQTVISTLQNQGKHDDALDLMDRRDAAFPEIADDKNLVKERKQSEKYRASGKKLNTLNLVDRGREGATSGSSGKWAKILFPLLLVAAIIGYLGYAAYLGQNQKIYLVNGTGKSYSVSVNGQPVGLPAFGHAKTTVSQGKVTITADGQDPIEQTITSSFWGRPFDWTMHLFNPDRLAVIEEEETMYSETVTTNPLPVVHFGKDYIVTKEPHFIFEAFPQTMRLKRGQSVTKKRIGMLSNLSTGQYLSLILDGKYQVDKNATLRRLCLQDGEDRVLKEFAAQILPPEEFQKLMASSLTMRPLRVEWHRLAQVKKMLSGDTDSLVEEYRKLLTEERSADAKYLLARVLPEGPEAEKLYEEARQADRPSAHAWSVLSINALGKANFPQAIEAATKAYEINPKNHNMQDQLIETLWAAGKYADLRERVTSMRNPMWDITLLQFRTAVAQNDPALILSFRTQHLTAPANRKRPQATLQNDLQLEECIIRGLRSEVVKCLKIKTKEVPEVIPGVNDQAKDDGEKFSEESFFLALLQGELTDAEAAYDHLQGAKNRLSHAGLLALAYAKKGNTEKVERYTRKMAEQLRIAPKTKAVAEMLAGDDPVDLAKIQKSPMNFDDKRVVCLVLALAKPPVTQELKAYAKKINTQKDLTSLLLKE